MLVITIIVLLILAGITISQLTKNGLIEKVQLAKERWDEAQDEENAILSEYEKAISGTSININIENDLQVTAANADVASADVRLEVNVEQKYENAVYIYIIEGKIVKYSDTNTAIIENLEPETNYEVIVMVIEGNQKIHRGSVKHTTRIANIDVYGKIQNIENLSKFGITYKRTGKSQQPFDELYKLGIGSNTGINTDTFTLTIDYNTLISQIGDDTFSGIYGQFYQNPYTDSTKYTSWVESKVIVNYDDNTKSEESTQRTTASNTSKIEEPYAAVKFEKDKKITTITMIMTLYDADWGGANGWIENIGLIPK